MRRCSDASVPCHRVIAAVGRIGGYGRDVYLKLSLLVAESVVVAGGRVRNFAAIRWRR